jgi:hypothetical protein
MSADTAVVTHAAMAIARLPVPTATADLAAMHQLPAPMDTPALHAVMAMPELHAAMHQLLADTPEPHAATTVAAQEWPPAAACAAAAVVAAEVAAPAARSACLD